MPTYSFHCETCNNDFDLFMTISAYQMPAECPECKANKIVRSYVPPTGCVKKGDDEITVGHLAHRNTERMSEDRKESIYVKNNAYRENPPPFKKPAPKKKFNFKSFRDKYK